MTAPPFRPTGARRDALDMLAVALVCLGGMMRLVHLSSNRSLYIDEARLALNIGARDLSQLGSPLDLEQVAPVPFLWAVKGVTLLLGMGETALRIVPFLAGVALLPVLWALFRRVAERKVALLALLLAALSPALIRSSNDAKQYSVDCLVTACVLLLAIKLVQEPVTRGGSLAFAALVVMSGTLSLPAPILVAPVVAVTAWQAVQRGQRHYALAWLGSLALCMTFSVALYSALSSVVGSSQYMQVYWQGALLRPDLPEFGARVASAASEMVWGGLTGGVAWVTTDQRPSLIRWTVVAGVVLLFVMGVRLALRRRGAALTALLVGPSLGLMFAGLAGLYPASLRLWLAAVPQWMLLVALGLSWSSSWLTQSGVLQGLLLAVAMLPSAVASMHPRMWPYLWQEVREPVERIRRSAPNQAVYIFANSAPAWLYYSTDWSRVDRERLRWYIERIQYGGAAFENATEWNSGEVEGMTRTHEGRVEILGAPSGLYWRPFYGLARDTVSRGWAREEARRITSSGCPQAWVLFSHYRGPENQLLNELERQGARDLVAYRRPGALLLRYQLPGLTGSSQHACADRSGTGRCSPDLRTLSGGSAQGSMFEGAARVMTRRLAAVGGPGLAARMPRDQAVPPPRPLSAGW